MAKRRVAGRCHICGRIGKLSKEHVPPQKALNDSKTYTYGGLQAVLTKRLPWVMDGLKGQQYQSGVTMYTLCGRCNNDTGGWYGGAFVDFTLQGALETIRRGASGTMLDVHFSHVRPLRVVKQVLAGFMSVNSPSLSDKHPRLRKLLLDKYDRGLGPTEFNVGMYIQRGAIGRYVGNASMMNFETGETRFVSEYPAPPFAYFLELNPRRPSQYKGITFFANEFDYDSETSMHLQIPIHETNTILPTDHRSCQQIIDGLESY